MSRILVRSMMTAFVAILFLRSYGIAGESKTDAAGAVFDAESFAKDTAEIDKWIGEMRFDEAINALEKLAALYPEPMKVKTENLRTAKKLFDQACRDVNAGTVKMSMSDFARRFAYAGSVVEVGPEGVVARSGRFELKKKWTELETSELCAFLKAYVAAKDTGENHCALATFIMLMTTDDDVLRLAGKELEVAKTRGADTSALTAYCELLKRIADAKLKKAADKAPPEKAPPQKAEAKEEKAPPGEDGKQTIKAGRAVIESGTDYEIDLEGAMLRYKHVKKTPCPKARIILVTVIPEKSDSGESTVRRQICTVNDPLSESGVIALPPLPKEKTIIFIGERDLAKQEQVSTLSNLIEMRGESSADEK